MSTLTPENAATVIKSYGGVPIKPVGPLDQGLALAIYGPGGTGKTTLAATITDTPLGSPALYFNARGNPFVVSSYADRLHVVDVTKFSQIEAVRKGLLDDPECPYKTVIYDTVTEMHAIRLREMYGATADITWQQHSATTADVLQLVRNAMELAESRLKMNVIFLFQETQELRTIKGQKDQPRSEIAVNKALQIQIPGIVTFVGRLYVDPAPPYTRILDFTPNESVHQSKMQRDPNNEYMRDMPMEQFNPSLASILETLRGVAPWPTAKHKSR